MKPSEKNDVLRIAVAAADERLLRVIGNYLLEADSFTQCDAYRRGKILLAQMRAGREFDALILDEQLADMDAVDFMEEYRTQKLQHRPAILVLSCRSHMAICDCLLSCGADYCIMKPYQLSTLARRARTLYRVKQDSLQDYCSRLYESWGVQGEITKCGYLTDAVTIAEQADDKLALRKQIIMTISEMRGVSVDAVDSGLRRLIERMEENNTPAYREFKLHTGLGETRPTVGRLVYAIKWAARQDANGKGEQNVRREEQFI